jgi:hypothetical protein
VAAAAAAATAASSSDRHERAIPDDSSQGYDFGDDDMEMRDGSPHRDNPLRDDEKSKALNFGLNSKYILDGVYNAVPRRSDVPAVCLDLKFKSNSATGHWTVAMDELSRTHKGKDVFVRILTAQCLRSPDGKHALANDSVWTSDQLKHVIMLLGQSPWGTKKQQYFQQINNILVKEFPETAPLPGESEGDGNPDDVVSDDNSDFVPSSSQPAAPKKSPTKSVIRPKTTHFVSAPASLPPPSSSTLSLSPDAYLAALSNDAAAIRLFLRSDPSSALPAKNAVPVSVHHGGAPIFPPVSKAPKSPSKKKRERPLVPLTDAEDSSGDSEVEIVPPKEAKSSSRKSRQRSPPAKRSSRKVSRRSKSPVTDSDSSSSSSEDSELDFIGSPLPSSRKSRHQSESDESSDSASDVSPSDSGDSDMDLALGINARHHSCGIVSTSALVKHIARQKEKKEYKAARRMWKKCHHHVKKEMKLLASKCKDKGIAAQLIFLGELFDQHMRTTGALWNQVILKIAHQITELITANVFGWKVAKTLGGHPEPGFDLIDSARVQEAVKITEKAERLKTKTASSKGIEEKLSEVLQALLVQTKSSKPNGGQQQGRGGFSPNSQSQSQNPSNQGNNNSNRGGFKGGRGGGGGRGGQQNSSQGQQQSSYAGASQGTDGSSGGVSGGQ